MNKKTKNMILLAAATLLSVLTVACGKVHNEISQIRVTNISVGNTKNFYEHNDSDMKSVTNNIDVLGACCCSDEEIETEPFYNGWVQFKIKNNLRYVAELSHFYYVVKNYYGGGNDYVSPNFSFIGSNIIDGAPTENENTDVPIDNNNNNNENEIVTYGPFSDAQGDHQRFASSNEVIEAVGSKNVIFYLTAITESGQVLTFSRSIPVDMTNLNQCEDDSYSCSCNF